jgi:hypothetical protein
MPNLSAVSIDAADDKRKKQNLPKSKLISVLYEEKEDNRL